jgi:sulfate transport system ATP-binding protein
VARAPFLIMSVSAANIRKTFGDYVALDDVSLRVPGGKLTALLGPSGSGKTTLLRIIAGLEFADAGSGVIAFDDVDVTAVPAGKRQVGFVFQHYALFRHMTVFENIAFGLRVRRKDRPSKPEIRDRVMRLLKLVQLEGYHDRLPTQLSGGQRQRVALARAIAVEPKVLLLDEPFGALDAKVRKELRRWLRRFHEEVHLTTIFVTHDQEEALEIADEVVIMNNARIEQTGSPQQVYDHPATPFVYEFLGNVNRVSLPSVGFDSAAAFGTNGGRVAYVRPHDVEVLPYAPDTVGEVAVVRGVHAAGPVARISCERTHRAGELIEVELPRSRFKELALAAGSVISLRVRHGREFAEDFSI